MSDAIITVENLSKKYLVGHQSGTRSRSNYTALRDVIGRGIRNVARKTVDVVRGRQIVQGDEVEEFWALKDVSFEVKRGEVLGIIGRNGAGKSTLLKILSRITEPTEGRVVLRGRVASLLEVGTGFHPELTGRENIFMNGAILGMTRNEICRKFDEIVAFAEVEKFLDTPVKHYSSGMYMRLAFAVAAHLEPEILIVDEVLAVGDAEFHKKCLGKMNDVSRHQGRTVLFVSHSMGAVTSLCPTAIWLDSGSIHKRGVAREVIMEYLSDRKSGRERVVRLADARRSRWVEDDRLRLRSIEWLCDLPLRHGEPIKTRICFDTRSPLSAVTVGIGFSNFEGVRLLTYETDFQEGYRPELSIPGNYSVDMAIKALPLAPSFYSLDIGCRSGDSHLLDYLPSCSQVEVVSGPTTPGFMAEKEPGVRLASEWSWEFARRPSELQLLP
jgi:lipopolysaccharide transport system ATP-binding protein